ncbi:ISAzo13 family transposase ISArch16 [subsurface metagenome]
MEYETAGDPISGLKWTHKTTEKIADELSLEGINICAVTVGRILKNLDYSLKSNSKKISNGGKKLTPEAVEKRNTQFEYIKAMLKKFDTENCPRISSDTKKKELVGNFKNPGTRYKKIADLVNDHDFLTYCIGKAALYGIYDLFNNDGFVVVGHFMKEEKTSSFLSADTPEFAVEAIESWWLTKGIKQYSKNKLLILVDGGGSNGHRCHMWKIKIQDILCNKHNLEVTVCHYPPGASKWNLIEHRLFSEISKNWKGTPLIDFETVLKYTKTTKTKNGLTVDAVLTNKEYQKGIKANREDITSLNLKKHKINGSWNYTICPQENLLQNIF